ncbi:hypothetical protein AO260_20990 [Pseudomonas sp. ABAC21]|nr:hypothetical protein AO260_20990 [Pseudomonas sp. ABAC21]
MNNRQVKAVVRKPREGIAIFHKLDEERRRPSRTTRPAVQVTKERWLMLAAEENFRIALGQVRSNRSQAYKGAW